MPASVLNALTIITYIIHAIDEEMEVHKNEVTCLRLVLTSGRAKIRTQAV